VDLGRVGVCSNWKFLFVYIRHSGSCNTYRFIIFTDAWTLVSANNDQLGALHWRRRFGKRGRGGLFQISRNAKPRTAFAPLLLNILHFVVLYGTERTIRTHVQSQGPGLRPPSTNFTRDPVPETWRSRSMCRREKQDLSLWLLRSVSTLVVSPPYL